MKHQCKLALIGTGAWGKNYLKESELLPNIRIIKTLDSSSQGQYLNILSKLNVDGVIIATPTSSHLDIARLLFDKYPLIVEKPFCTDLMLIKDFCSSYNINCRYPLLINYIHLYSEPFIHLKKELNSKRYGEILKIESSAGNYGPFREDTSPLWDWGVHDIAMCISLLGIMPYDFKSESIQRSFINNTQAMNINIRLEFNKNISANINIGNLFKNKARKFSVYTENFTFIYNPFDQYELTIIDNVTSVEKKLFPIEKRGDRGYYSPLSNLLMHFSQVINKTNIKNQDNLQLTLNVSKILDSLDKKVKGSN